MTVQLYSDIEQLFDQLNVVAGMTLSFHHHLRNGDQVVNLVCDEIKKRDIRNLTFAPSSIFPVHAPMVELIKNQNITKIYTDYINGPVGECVSKGFLKNGIVMQSHGGRPRSIENNELVIDIAFIAVSIADRSGNANGIEGTNICGVLGYPQSDIKHAKKVVLVTDTIVDTIEYKEIEGKYIDSILKVNSIGDSNQIVSGTTNITKDPVGLKIAKDTKNLIKELGLIRPNFSFQTGAGGISLAVAKNIKEEMIKEKVTGSFISGGITSYHVQMLEAGLFRDLFDVQCFDLEAIKSLKRNKHHHPMSASQYANPDHENAIVNQLDFVILGATEIDLNFNVNVTTDSKGILIGGSGGHCDTAHGAKCTIIVSQLIKARTPIIKDQVLSITTPGSDVDVLVTERGIAINPIRFDLLERLKYSKLNVMTIEELQQMAFGYTKVPKPHQKSDQIIGVVEYRDGTIIDYLYKVVD